MLDIEQASAKLVVAEVNKQPITSKSPRGNAATPNHNIEIKTRKEEKTRLKRQTHTRAVSLEWPFSKMLAAVGKENIMR